MKTYDVVVVGGGPAGIQAAISARNTYPQRTVALIRREPTALIPCGIPYIFHSLDSVRDDVLPDALLHRCNVDIVIGLVTGRDGRVVCLQDGRQIGFERLVLATGSVPIRPAIPGIDQPGVHLLTKDLDDLEALKEALSSTKRILCVGGGYAGVELADELAQAGHSVSLVEMQESLLPASVDPEFAAPVQEALEKRGVEVILGSGVRAFVGKTGVSGADLEDGRWITADAVVVSVGFRPHVELARKLGLRVDDKYGIVVDEYLRTSDPDIFAVGDCATKQSCFTGEYRQVMLASTAMSQGRLAGSNLFGINVVKSFPGTLGSFATKVADIALNATGLTETRARNMGLEYVVGKAETVDRHPASLPGANRTRMKLVFARYSHLLVGAQVLGGDAVGEATNMLSVMIQKRMTDMEIDTLQIGTHPLLTASPLGYAVISATADAIVKWAPRESSRFTEDAGIK